MLASLGSGPRFVQEIGYSRKAEQGDFRSTEPDSPAYSSRYSVGIEIKKDGTIADVLAGSPAYDAGLGPETAILAGAS